MSPSVEPFNEAKYKALTDGLEIKEITIKNVLQNKDGRIDSQFWTTEIVKNANLKYSKIGKILLRAQYGISIDMNEKGIGYPIYRMNEIHNSLCDLEVKKFADVSASEARDYMLCDGDVLFNRTNSYEWVGRTGIYYKEKADEYKIFASYLVRLIPDRNIILPEYLTAFLNTSFGIRNIKARARQSVNQTNVNSEEVKEIEIPIASPDFQKAIQSNYHLAHQKLVLSKLNYCEAEKILNRYLGLTNLLDNSPTTKTLSMSFLKFSRLDAEYYQPKYDALFEILSKFNTERLGGKNGLVSIQKSIEPGSDAYRNEGIPFVRVSDLNKYELNNPAIKLSPTVGIENLFPRKDTILLSKDGSVGIAYKLQEDKKIVTSGALLHLTVKDTNRILPDYLTLVLNSPIVQLQAERDCYGAIIQHWSLSDIEKVVIPVLNMEKQREIALKVQESFRLRKEAKLLLNRAIKAVETAIETDEATALSKMQLS